MKLSFVKMNGAGNDFVMLDNRKGQIQLSREQIAHVCNRHRGVGSDGLLLVESSDSTGADFRMRYYNSDGSEAEMCGNGARCFARFVKKLGACHDKLSFQTLAGLIGAKFEGQLVEINLSAPGPMRLNETVKLAQGDVKVHSVNTGVPHAVLFVEDADKAMVGPVGAELRYHAHFVPKGTNVNFVQLQGGSAIRVRTYERGVEGETLACGTGVTASALMAHALHGLSSPISVKVQGGDTLRVSFKKTGDGYTDVLLQGPADITFEGAIEI